MPTAAILIIGNEILSGRTREANMHWLSGELKTLGITLRECRIVRDETAEIIDAVNALRQLHDTVFTSGGIGPTHDDITAQSIADAFGTTLHTHPEADRILRQYYADSELTEARMKMAKVPQGATLIPNPVSAAPGFVMENVYVMAGVPRIFQAMVQQIKSQLTTGRVAQSITVITAGREGEIATPLGEIQAQYPHVELGSYPFMKDGALGTNIVLTATDATALEQATQHVEAMLQTQQVDCRRETQ